MQQKNNRATWRNAVWAMPLLVTLSMPAWAAKREFNMTIEDTTVHLTPTQTFHTFAFDGQVPGPLIHVKEGDEVTVHVTNTTTLPHTIHWHGMLQKGTWKMDGVPDTTQDAIKPGDTYTYKFIAEPSGTMWYHCHVNVNEHAAMRGMYGPLIVDPKKPVPIEKKVTKDVVMMLSDWASKWANKPGYGGVPGDVWDYFTMNGKSFPYNMPIRVKKGDVVRIRIIGAGEMYHSIHIHGHVFQIAFKDGRPLKNPIEADTVSVGPGERYDLILKADNPGRWMVHDHVDSHTMNGDKPMGGIMSVIEYAGVETSDPWYVWKDLKYVPNFYYEDSMKKPYGKHDNPDFKGVPAQ